MTPVYVEPDSAPIPGRHRESRARIAVSSVSIILYGASLCSPALEFSTADPVPGWETLLAGWAGIFLLQPAWLANPVFFIALILFKRRKYHRAKTLSAMALVIGLSSFFCREWYFNEAFGTPITSLGIGFYLWCLSFTVLAAGIGFWINPAVEADEKERTGPRQTSAPTSTSDRGSP